MGKRLLSIAGKRAATTAAIAGATSAVGTPISGAVVGSLVGVVMTAWTVKDAIDLAIDVYKSMDTKTIEEINKLENKPQGRHLLPHQNINTNMQPQINTPINPSTSYNKPSTQPIINEPTYFTSTDNDDLKQHF